jgi:hypothetical protein
LNQNLEFISQIFSENLKILTLAVFFFFEPTRLAH